MPSPQRLPFSLTTAAFLPQNGCFLSPQVLAAKPKKGNAVLFHSIKPSGELERRSLHTAWWVVTEWRGCAAPMLCCAHAVLCCAGVLTS